MSDLLRVKATPNGIMSQHIPEGPVWPGGSLKALMAFLFQSRRAKRLVWFEKFGLVANSTTAKLVLGLKFRQPQALFEFAGNTGKPPGTMPTGEL